MGKGEKLMERPKLHAGMFFGEENGRLCTENRARERAIRTAVKCLPLKKKRPIR